MTINHGITQGTVPGPLIFILFSTFYSLQMTCIICHSKSAENLLFEINNVFENTESYMSQNMLTLNRDKTEIEVFSRNGESKIEQLHYNGIFKEPKTNCRYLDIMIDNNLNFDIQLNKTLTKWQLLLAQFT